MHLLDERTVVYESAELEFKRELTKTAYKTVSAYANYGTGRIVFGVEDDGTVVGIDDPDELCQKVENTINDAVSPVPRYHVEINESDKTVVLTVYEGDDKPYLYDRKAYRRRGVSTREVDRTELNRLILAGSNRSFDSLEARNQDLSFGVLTDETSEKLGLEALGVDALVSLELMDTQHRYTNAAALLADENDFPGCDVARFGESQNIILGRNTYDSISILRQLKSVISMFMDHYVYEEVVGTERVVKSLIPVEAFRETVANALVHRCWDIRSHIKISMYLDRIEVISPGGLPEGISDADYLAGGPSIARNPILANVLFRLGYIERFGTGIPRIKDSYKDSAVRPSFTVTDTSIRVVLPVVSGVSLSKEERQIQSFLADGRAVSRAEVQDHLGITKGQAIRALNGLVDKGLVIKEGAGPSVVYHLA